MGKYTTPAVSFGDLSAALPALDAPWGWRVAFYPKPQNTTALHACVELVFTLPNGHQVVYQRFWRAPRGPAVPSVLAALLVACQEASWWIQHTDLGELRKLVEWNADIPLKV